MINCLLGKPLCSSCGAFHKTMFEDHGVRSARDLDCVRLPICPTTNKQIIFVKYRFSETQAIIVHPFCYMKINVIVPICRQAQKHDLNSPE